MLKADEGSCSAVPSRGRLQLGMLLADPQSRDDPAEMGIPPSTGGYDAVRES
jgi:hypothetical protein